MKKSFHLKPIHQPQYIWRSEEALKGGNESHKRGPIDDKSRWIKAFFFTDIRTNAKRSRAGHDNVEIMEMYAGALNKLKKCVNNEKWGI